MLKILEDLVKLARERQNNPVEGSYTNKLLEHKTLAKEKVLEEINELIEAVEQDSNKIHEAADVFYHLIMFLEGNGVKIEQIMQELSLRKKWYIQKILIKTISILWFKLNVYFLVWAINSINQQDQDYKEVN